MSSEGSAVRLPESALRQRSPRPAPELQPPAPPILVCLDRSSLSEQSLPHALSLAAALGSAVTFVHVMQHARDQAAPQNADALGWEIARQEARGELEQLQERAEAQLGRTVEVRLEQGRPSERIAELVRELGAAMIVLGGRGERGSASPGLGSTALEILAAAPCSVFIAHPRAGEDGLTAPKRILVPLDGSVRTEAALAMATRIARHSGAALVLVHVVEEPVLNLVLRADRGLELARELAGYLERGAARYLEGLREKLCAEGAAVRALVLRHANPRQGLLELAQKEQIDLIVLSAHGAACDPARSFGGVAADLLAHAVVPLLALQDLPGGELLRAQPEGGSLAGPLARGSSGRS